MGKNSKFLLKMEQKSFIAQILKWKLIFSIKKLKFYNIFAEIFLFQLYTIWSDLKCLDDPGLNLLGEGLCGSPLLLCLRLCSVQHLKILPKELTLNSNSGFLKKYQNSPSVSLDRIYICRRGPCFLLSSYLALSPSLASLRKGRQYLRLRGKEGGVISGGWGVWSQTRGQQVA